MQHYREFDFVVVNDRFEQAAAELESILDGHSEALRADRAALAPVLQRLLG
jgi:guanylate kinase